MILKLTFIFFNKIIYINFNLPNKVRNIWLCGDKKDFFHKGKLSQFK